MKSIALVIAGIAVMQVLPAQEKQDALTGGTVKYEEKVKLEIHLDGDGAQFANMLPKERKSNKILIFNNESALYTNDKESAEEDLAMEGEGGMVQIRMMEPDNKMFTDLKNRKQIEQREFMTRMFLIESDMNASPWKFTGNEKDILGYTCQEAVLEKDSTKTVAWFTPAIPIPFGPGNYNNLPGLVLAVDIDNGQRVLTALSIDPVPADKSKLVKPKDGKKVTEEEFKAIVDEKMKEMGAEHGGVGKQQHIMIRIEK